MNDNSCGSIDYMRYPFNKSRKTLAKLNDKHKLLSNVKSGFELTKEEINKPELPVISINTGTERFSYPLEEYSRNIGSNDTMYMV